MNKINSITIVGSSSGKNAGDAALLSGIMDSIDSACERKVNFEIPTYRPEYIRNNYANSVTPVSMLPYSATVGMLGFPTLASLRRSRVTLIYDAMLFDRNLWNPLVNYMSTAWAFLKFLKKQGNILGFYNVGAGPVNTDWGRKMLADLTGLADFITVRDADSYKLLKELGANEDKMLITADAAITVNPCSEDKIQKIYADLGINPAEPVLGINVNQYINTWSGVGQQNLNADTFAEIYAEAINRFASEQKLPVLFVVTQPNDIPVTKKVMDLIKPSIKKEMFVNIGFNHYDIKGVLSKLSLLFAMRLHANILATSAFVPSISLAFQKKVASYYDVLGLSENCMSFANFSAESVYNHINLGWQKRHADKALLQKRIPELAGKAIQTAQIIKAIDSGADYLAVLKSFK